MTWVTEQGPISIIPGGLIEHKKPNGKAVKTVRRTL